MPIFQKSIVDKYVATIDVDVIDKAFESYKHIYSTQKIQRIKKLKEEQYQGGFLKDIFGSVLGYTIDPEVGYNLELEKKNETDTQIDAMVYQLYGLTEDEIEIVENS